MKSSLLSVIIMIYVNKLTVLLDMFNSLTLNLKLMIASDGNT